MRARYQLLEPLSCRLQIIESNPTTIASENVSAISLLYTYTDSETGAAVKSMDLLALPDRSNKTYLITFKDENSAFDAHLLDAQKMVDSIQFLK